MAAAEIPCPRWCVQDHREDSWHERRVLSRPLGAEVDAMLIDRPGHQSVKWTCVYLKDDEGFLSPAEARQVAQALLEAAAILDATPGVF